MGLHSTVPSVRAEGAALCPPGSAKVLDTPRGELCDGRYESVQSGLVAPRGELGLAVEADAKGMRRRKEKEREDAQMHRAGVTGTLIEVL